MTAPTSVALAEPLLTADDVAELLSIPRSSVYEYTRHQHNPLPSIPVGRYRRFHRSALEAWLTACQSAGPRSILNQ
ncbi:MAG TPA: helix-turn-helix domain-containing protein [Baekduia sp.]|uniref:helix-turn-helix domain-containing protein n=1 Tax=Baekduia sp. TaxID=2600305 RepID=UPI002D76C242|nr:helix-turn-helix domain-containing protein [Baekduia sp.]HET6505616.1 helix-turn-helix domain-containing protein [Baekduia sp.]